MTNLAVSEIFTSIQGEGTRAGVPMVFVRLYSCNLSCKYCDSRYAIDGKSISMSDNDIVNEVIREAKEIKWVYLTGGEPLFQFDGLTALVKLLKHRGFNIIIATNGSLPRPNWWNYASWDIDCKCPSSGESAFNADWLRVGQKNSLKFVVGDETDLAFVLSYNNSLSLYPIILVSPVMPSSQEWLQQVWWFCVEHNLRLSFQNHKIFWGNKKGI